MLFGVPVRESDIECDPRSAHRDLSARVRSEPLLKEQGTGYDCSTTLASEAGSSESRAAVKDRRTEGLKVHHCMALFGTTLRCSPRGLLAAIRISSVRASCRGNEKPLLANANELAWPNHHRSIRRQPFVRHVPLYLC
eukprot:COSAG03_NODE_54_length_16022_cov_3.869811_3_plen_138_part_00